MKNIRGKQKKNIKTILIDTLAALIVVASVPVMAFIIMNHNQVTDVKSTLLIAGAALIALFTLLSSEN